jgi:hypothetical protein
MGATLDDATLGAALSAFRGEGGPTPGSVLFVALLGRKDLLPEVRAALHRAEPGSDLAAACLVAVQWLGDDDPASVPTIVRHLGTHTHHATNALLANGTLDADEELVAELCRRPDLQLAAILANVPRHRAAGVEGIRRAASDVSLFRWHDGLAKVVALLEPEALSALADCSEVYAIAEEVGYGPYERSRILGEKPAALRIIGVRHPDAAVRTALSRLRDPVTPDGELYVPFVVTMAPDRAAAEFLDLVRQDPLARVIRAVGCELTRLDATVAVSEWLADPAAERRLAA